MKPASVIKITDNFRIALCIPIYLFFLIPFLNVFMPINIPSVFFGNSIQISFINKVSAAIISDKRQQRNELYRLYKKNMQAAV